jgi:hypothetical protein
MVYMRSTKEIWPAAVFDATNKLAGGPEVRTWEVGSRSQSEQICDVGCSRTQNAVPAIGPVRRHW